MYLEFFGLREKPFSQTPDPRFLYWNDSYREALASLRYGIQERKGFLTFIGEAGTGKTTLLRKLLGELGPDVLSVFLFNPDVGFEEILQYTLGELGIACPTQRRLDMLQRLNEFLLAAYAEGRNTVLLIDEAQDLDSGVLESLRLLSNLETSSDKILQIVLCGQPELARRLAQPNLRQLKQRIAVRCRLEPLRRAEIPDYVATRTKIAGAARSLFDDSCMPAIWEFSGGIPRLVNMACDNALLVAYAVGKRSIDAAVLEEVVHDLSRLDVMDLSEDFIERSPGQTSGPDAGVSRAPDRLPLLSSGPDPLAAASVPVAPDPVPARSGDASAPPQAMPVPGPIASGPRGRSVSTNWLPWVALGGAVLGAIVATGVSHRAPGGEQPRRAGGEFARPAPPAAATAPLRLEPTPIGGESPTPEAAEATGAPERTRIGGGAPGAALATPPSTASAAMSPMADATRSPQDSGSPAPSNLPTNSPDSAVFEVSPTPTFAAGALGPLENRRALVRRGDTLSNLAREVYGRESLTMLDIVGRANPELSDLDHIEPGQTVLFPEPRPEARVLGDGPGASVLVLTTRERVSAERARADLPAGLLGLATVEPGRLGSLRVYRVLVRDLGGTSPAQAAADRLGPPMGPESGASAG